MYYSIKSTAHNVVHNLKQSTKEKSWDIIRRQNWEWARFTRPLGWRTIAMWHSRDAARVSTERKTIVSATTRLLGLAIDQVSASTAQQRHCNDEMQLHPWLFTPTTNVFIWERQSDQKPSKTATTNKQTTTPRTPARWRKIAKHLHEPDHDQVWEVKYR